MHPRSAGFRPRRAPLLLVALVCLALIAPAGAARADGAASGATGSTAAPTTSDAGDLAQQALDVVQGLLTPATASAPSSSATSPSPSAATAPEAPVTGPDAPGGERDATLALRDLALYRSDLPRSERATAARLLARPTDGSVGGCDGLACYTRPERTPSCGTFICVHSVADGADAATPEFVAQALATVESVAGRYLASGYRPTVSDGSRGGNGLFDVYLADLGARGLYGYCAPEATGFAHATSSAYCVLDNDYVARQFGSGRSPLDNLQVTAAHEFFHAVQFAYDYGEDGWIMEATATWAEDELYSAVDDNRQYLRFGPLGRPSLSLDTWSGVYQYGAWIFIRFLSERYPAAPAPGTLPSIVRRIWEFLGSGQYSVQGVTSALAEVGTTLPYTYAKFVAANRRPYRTYTEGGAYAAAPVQTSYRLTSSRRTREHTFGLDHLAAKTYRFVPGMRGRWKLAIRVNLNSTAAGGYAIVTVGVKGVGPVQKRIRLDRAGRGIVRVPFGSKVSWVELHAVNASSRFTRCGSRGDDTTATCQGFAVDDGLRQRFEVKAYRA